VQDGRFRFHVEIGLPLLGLIVAYRGWLVPRDDGEGALQHRNNVTRAGTNGDRST